MNLSRPTSPRTRWAVPLLAIIAACATVPAPASAQSEDRHDEHTVTSAVPSSARFEIVQSTLAALQTFKLDKQTGSVQLLVKKIDGSDGWEDLEVVGLKAVPASGNRFQLFLSGIAAKYTFLLDTQTGTCWQFVFAEDEKTKEKTDRCSAQRSGSRRCLFHSRRN